MNGRPRPRACRPCRPRRRGSRRWGPPPRSPDGLGSARRRRPTPPWACPRWHEPFDADRRIDDLAVTPGQDDGVDLHGLLPLPLASTPVGPSASQPTTSPSAAAARRSRARSARCLQTEDRRARTRDRAPRMPRAVAATRAPRPPAGRALRDRLEVVGERHAERPESPASSAAITSIGSPGGTRPASNARYAAAVETGHGGRTRTTAYRAPGVCARARPRGRVMSAAPPCRKKGTSAPTAGQRRYTSGRASSVPQHSARAPR